MAQTHVLAALIDKRSRLAGRRDHYRRRADEARRSIAEIGAVIRQFDPTFSARGLRPTRYTERNTFFVGGEGGTVVLSALRGEAHGDFQQGEGAGLRREEEVLSVCRFHHR